MNLSFFTLLVTAMLSCGESASMKSWLRKLHPRLPQSPPRTRSVTSPVTCVEGDGGSYRGSVSVSAGGHACVNWNEYFYINAKAHAHGLGYHNHCRNHNRRSRPWCLVRRGRRSYKQFCDIPKCTTDPPMSTPAPQTSLPTTVVTDPPTSTASPLTSLPPALDTETTCGEKGERRFKVVGGSVAAIESQPWTAAIFLRQKRGSEKFMCGGSLIAPCWVLTAAHCFDEIDSTKILPPNLRVYLGKSATNETHGDREQKFAVEQFVVHKGYKGYKGYDNDIALVKLQSSGGACAVKSDAVRTVCLPPPRTRLPPGTFCTVVGYGREREGAAFSKYLKQADVQILSHRRCQGKSYPDNVITDNMFCAGSPDWSADACQGDSGGPLVCDVNGRVFAFGVVSWGEGCARTNKPGVYTRITNFNSWIAEETGLPAYTAGVMYPVK